jgi:hypothetical protein
VIEEQCHGSHISDLSDTDHYTDSNTDCCVHRNCNVTCHSQHYDNHVADCWSFVGQRWCGSSSCYDSLYANMEIYVSSILKMRKQE